MLLQVGDAWLLEALGAVSQSETEDNSRLTSVLSVSPYLQHANFSLKFF